MKKLFLTLSLLITAVVIAQAQQTTTASVDENGPKIKFEEKSFEFGTITQGDVVEHTFKFTNDGKEPLILSNVRTTCGCTVPQWPKTPITPGSSEEIHVKFNSTGKMGQQNKVITILSNNTKGDVKISLTGTVEAKKN